MTPKELQDIISLLDDEHGRGGQSELARRCNWAHSTVWRKLNGVLPITEEDAVFIRHKVPEWKG